MWTAVLKDGTHTGDGAGRAGVERGSDNHMYRLDYYFWTIQESWIPDGHDVKGGAKHNGVAPGHQTIGI